MSRRPTAIIRREGDGFVSFRPESDIASQGRTVEAARESLKEALEGFNEVASGEEVADRLGAEVEVTQVEAVAGSGSGSSRGGKFARSPRVAASSKFGDAAATFV